ncbi:hypothetical protein PoB_004968800 [Plakobranchus ocellatus]|uniref:Uncharacterized protein n=1 Tax=Plakobranchus ocellatus TaxID=259542 RepID=A0AAV4BU97_9GAST|nr:hypothetical protein PoB_004968800 [Plakobranchus ocellatus]
MELTKKKQKMKMGWSHPEEGNPTRISHNRYVSRNSRPKGLEAWRSRKEDIEITGKNRTNCNGLRTEKKKIILYDPYTPSRANL